MDRKTFLKRLVGALVVTSVGPLPFPKVEPASADTKIWMGLGNSAGEISGGGYARQALPSVEGGSVTWPLSTVDWKFDRLLVIDQLDEGFFLEIPIPEKRVSAGDWIGVEYTVNSQ